LEDKLKLLQLTCQDTWLNALELADLSSYHFSVVDDVVVLAAFVNKQKIVIHAVLWLVIVCSNHHFESDVVWIILVSLEVIKFYLGVLEPSFSFFKLSVVNLLKIF